MGDNINVPIKVRSNELRQAKDMMPAVSDSLTQAGLDEAAEEVDRIYESHISDVEATYPEGPQFAAYLSMPAEDWRMTIRYLNRARRDEGRTRVHWLQSKFVNRLNERMEEMENE